MRRPLLLVLCLLGSLASLGAPRKFDIPAQAADTALLAFVQQGDCDLLFSADELRERRSRAVLGVLEPEQALARLLEGTGYSAQKKSPNKFILRKLPPPKAELQGRVLNTRGEALEGVAIVLLPGGQQTRSDPKGGFCFQDLAPGDYGLSLSGTLHHPSEIQRLSLLPEKRLFVEARLTPSNEALPLAPLYVEGAPTNRNLFKRSQLSSLPQSSIGNLDLVRSEDDALAYRSYSRDQIQRSGVLNLNEFLRRELLDSDASTLPPEQNADALGMDAYAMSSSNLSLRGYSSEETIILVNGRRLPEILTSNRESGPPQPDVNLIPLGLVERIEVLPVSSAALYSGNPVGGVINILLRPNTDLTELTLGYGNTLGGYDAPQTSASLQHGRSLLGGRLRYQLNAYHLRSFPSTEAELGHIQSRNEEVGLRSGLPYRATPNLESLGGTPLFGPGTPTFSSVAPGEDGKGGLAPFLTRQGLASTALFDAGPGLANSPNAVNYPYGRLQERSTFHASSTYDLCPWLELGFSGMYSSTRVHRGRFVFTGDLELKGSSPNNPFGQDLRIHLNENTPLLGENYGEGQLEFGNGVLGLLARLPANWTLASDLQFSRSLTRQRGLARVDAERWQALVDSGEYNPLRDTQAHGPPDSFYQKALVYYGAKDRFITLGDYTTIDGAVRLSNRDLRLPAGGGVVNLGTDYRRNQLSDFTNEQRYGDGSLAASPIRWQGRSIERVSVFGELQAPLLPQSARSEWLRGLELDLAARYQFSSNNAESNLAPTGALKAVLGAGFSLRAAVAVTNRLPSPVMSLKRPNGDNPDPGGEIVYSNIYDPVRDENYNILSHDAVNSALHSEAAITKGAGLIWVRGKVHRFRVSLDFSDTDKTGELSYLDAQSVVNLETQLPERVERSAPQPGDPSPVGRIGNVLTGSFNLARRHSQNWIASLDYQWREAPGGVLELNARWYYYHNYLLQLVPDGELVDELGHPDGAAPRLLRNRGFVSLSWSDKRQGFGVDAHLYDRRILPKVEWRPQGSDHVDATWHCGAYVQEDLAPWLLPEHSHLGLRAQLRVDNLLNAAPPRYANAASGSGVQSYSDWRGRYYTLSVTLSF